MCKESRPCSCRRTKAPLPYRRESASKAVGLPGLLLTSLGLGRLLGAPRLKLRKESWSLRRKHFHWRLSFPFREGSHCSISWLLRIDMDTRLWRCELWANDVILRVVLSVRTIAVPGEFVCSP